MPANAAVWLTRLVVLLAGVALAHSFAPYELWWLAPIAIAVLAACITKSAQTPRAAGWLGFWFGLGYFSFGVYWVYFSLHLFGAAIAPLAVFLTVLMVVVMALYPVLFCYWFARFKPRNSILQALLFASLWVLTELFRGWIVGGFPWVLVGYSQTLSLLGNWAPVIGVRGISFLLIAISALLGISAMRRQPIMLLVGIGLCGVVWAISSALGTIEFTTPKAQKFNVRLVQANIAQEMKFSRERLNNSISQYTEMTLDQLPANTQLVIWPETAIPTYFDLIDDALKPFADSLTARNVDVLTGGFYRDNGAVYNSVRQLGGERALYLKRHLVPFGEFIPGRFFLNWVNQFIDIPMSDLAAGSGPLRPLQLQGESIGVSICYEDVFGEELVDSVPAATLLVNVSNDAWFGDSAAPHQHEQKARMRARELGRPMLRVTNTGVSSAIDHKGRILGRIHHNQAGVLDVAVGPRTGTTPYARWSDWPVALVIMLSLLSCLGTHMLGRGRK